MPVCSTGKEGRGALSKGPLDQLSAAEAGSNPEKPLHTQQTPTSLFDDDEEMDGQEEVSEQGSPFVGSECSADLDGDQLSVLLQPPSQEGLDALLLCSSLFSGSVSNSTAAAAITMGLPGLDDGLPDQRPAAVDAELFDSFLDLDWSAIEQSAGTAAAVTASGPIFFPTTTTTALLESSV